jgi:hypothetical protein
MNTAMQQARYVQSGFLNSQFSIHAYADGACGFCNGADAPLQPGRQPRGRRTYHSVNSRQRPAESNRITKQLS